MKKHKSKTIGRPCTQVERVCENCKKHFFAISYYVRYGGAKYCSIGCSKIAKPRMSFAKNKLKISKLTIEKKCYLAGIVDGEGYIRKEKPYQVTIGNTSKSLAKWLKKHLDFGKLYWRQSQILTVRGNLPKKAFTFYICNASGLYLFLKAIEPYLVIKRRKAQETIKFLNKRFHFE